MLGVTLRESLGKIPNFLGGVTALTENGSNQMHIAGSSALPTKIKCKRKQKRF